MSKLKMIGMLAAIIAAGGSAPGPSSFEGVGVTVAGRPEDIELTPKQRRPKSARRLKLRRTRGWR